MALSGSFLVASAVLALVYAFLPAFGATLDLGVTALVTVLAVWAAGLGDRIWGHDLEVSLYHHNETLIQRAAEVLRVICL